jgi:hypothetical protein
MKETDQITIPLSKRKIVLLMIGSLIFVILGTLLILYPERFLTLFFRNEEIIRIIGFAGILFFGFCSIFFVKKLFDNKPGLIINKNGIIDNTSGIASGLIEWHDIKEIKILEIVRQKIILIIVANPDDYIARQKSAFKRKIMKLNYDHYDTPIQIITNGLKCSHTELFEMINSCFKKYKE